MPRLRRSNQGVTPERLHGGSLSGANLFSGRHRILRLASCVLYPDHGSRVRYSNPVISGRLMEGPRPPLLPRRRPRSVVSWPRTAFCLGCAIVSLLLVCDLAADEGSTDSGEETSPKHRIDFGVQWYDAAEGNSATGSLSYSWVPLDHHAFAATLLLVGSDLSNAKGSGVGEMLGMSSRGVSGFTYTMRPVRRTLS